MAPPHPLLERVSSRHSQHSRYTDPWTEPLDDEEHPHGRVHTDEEIEEELEDEEDDFEEEERRLSREEARRSGERERRGSGGGGEVRIEMLPGEGAMEIDTVEEEEDLQDAIEEADELDMVEEDERAIQEEQQAESSQGPSKGRGALITANDFADPPTSDGRGALSTANDMPNPPSSSSPTTPAPPGRTLSTATHRPRGQYPPARFMRPHGPRMRKTLSIPRTLSTMSGRSLRSVRDHSIGFIFKVWMSVFPPPDPEAALNFIPNYRYTPILSGIVVPFAILLEIPGLTEHWYIRTENNVTIDYQPNPIILDVGLALSMTCALIANIALIFRFLERRVKLMTIIACSVLLCHDVINTVAVTIFGVVHRFNDGFTYGEAFWMTVCSTVASSFVTATLIYDLVKTKDFARSGSGLTAKQRSLVIVVMVLICYVALGALVNCFAIGLSFQDALYFTIVSIETIGFGDIVPLTVFARIWVCAYVTLGVLNLALAVSTTRETIVEAFENSYRIRRAEIHRRRKEHREAKRRRIEAEQAAIAAGLAPRYVRVRVGRGGAGVMRAVSDAPLSPVSPTAAMSPTSIFSPVTPGAPSNSPQDGSGSGSTAVDTPQPSIEETKRMADELRQDVLLENGTGAAPAHEEESYLEFRRHMEREEKREFITKLAVAWSIFFAFWIAGAAIFMKTEEWTFSTGLYFCFVAFSTIGYGDKAPSSPAGRSIFTVWALAGVAAMTILVSVVSEAYASRYKNVLSHGMLERAVKAFRDREANEDQDTINEDEEKRTPRQSLERTVSREQEREKERQRSLLEKAKRELEALPAELLRHARSFHEHVHFFAKQSHGGPPPPGLQKLLDDIAETEHMDHRQKESLMADEEAKKGRTLHKLIHTAEKAVELLAIREKEHKALMSLSTTTNSRLSPPPLDTRRLVSEPAVSRVPESVKSDIASDTASTLSKRKDKAKGAARPRVRINVTDVNGFAHEEKAE